jgi:K+/H+ antiporter YhaU regulatory subunit KhtT
MSPEMKSKYLATAATELVDRAALDEAKRKELEECEGIIKVLRTSEKKAMVQIREDLKKKLITEPQAILERATVQAEVLEKVSEQEARCREILPSWSSTISANVQNALDTASKTTVNNSGKVGENVGKVLSTPWQAFRSGIDGFKKGANHPIGR